MSNFTILIQATLDIYWSALKKTWNGFCKNWWCIFLPIIYSIILFVVGGIIKTILPGILGGFALGLLTALLLANYFVFLSASVENEKIALSEIKQDTFALFGPTINVMFILWIVTFIQQMLFVGQGYFLSLAISLLIFILFNVLPEIIYQHQEPGMVSFERAFQFIKENFFEWFIPHLLILFLVFGQAVFSSSGLIMLVQTDILRPTSMLADSTGILVSLFLLHFVMIFRGVLYHMLNSKSRNKRVYDYKNNFKA